MLLAFAFYVPFYPFQTWYIATVEKSLIHIGDWGFVIAQVTVMVINFVLEYLWQTFVVFRKSIDTNTAAQKQQQNVAETDDGTQDKNSADNAEQAVQTKDKAKDIATDNLSQKIEVDVVLVDAGKDKIAVIKVLREVLSLELSQAKTLAENTPATIAENKLKDEAVVIADKLRNVGATVELK